jgi:hypothetical protein
VLGLKARGLAAATVAVGATKYKVDNGVKILPSLLEQLGLLRIEGGECRVTPAGVAVVSVGTAVPPIPAQPSSHQTAIQRNRRAGYPVASPGDVHPLPSTTGRTRTTEEQLHSAALLDERTAQHQNLVKSVVASLRNVSNLRCSDDAFDILAKSTSKPEHILIEAKTVRGDPLAQARTALGQLLYYQYFDIDPIGNGTKTIKVVAFDNDPGERAKGFLAAYGVECITVKDGKLTVPDSLRDYFWQP